MFELEQRANLPHDLLAGFRSDPGYEDRLALLNK
jgi:hypothetical protein